MTSDSSGSDQMPDVSQMTPQVIWIFSTDTKNIMLLIIQVKNKEPMYIFEYVPFRGLMSSSDLLRADDDVPIIY